VTGCGDDRDGVVDVGDVGIVRGSEAGAGVGGMRGGGGSDVDEVRVNRGAPTATPHAADPGTRSTAADNADVGLTRSPLG